MTQLGLLSYTAPVASPSAPEQAKQAARVGRGIDEAVMVVARRAANAHARDPGPFLFEAFACAVQRVLAERGRKCNVDSVRRRLHDLVAQGLIDAECIDRSRSLWVVRGVRGEGAGR